MELDQFDQAKSEAVFEMNRLIEIGKLLASVLTEEEIATLRLFMGGSGDGIPKDLKNHSTINIGNTSVT